METLYKQEVLNNLKDGSMIKSLISDAKPLIFNLCKEIAWKTWKEGKRGSQAQWVDERIRFENWYNSVILN